MADNITITEGTGTDVATDEVGGKHYQKVKVYDGTADSTNGLVVDNAGRVYIRSVVDGTVTANVGTGTMAIKADDGTFAVFFSPSEPTIKGITNSIDVYLGATAGTIRVGDIPGSMAVYFSPSNPAIKAEHNITTIGDGRKVVTTAGTREALASSTPCKRVVITAETDNTGIIVVGGSTVVAATATRQGTPLYAGDSFELEIDNLADVYLDATVDGEGVTYTYFN